MPAPTPIAWNYNNHYHRFILSMMPRPCSRALEVGCGDGALAQQMMQFAGSVTGIDRSTDCVHLAQGNDVEGRVEYLCGDFLPCPLAPASFEFIASIAALHHMDEEHALRRMKELLKPGGTLAIIGLGKSRYPADLARDSVAVAFDRVHRLGSGYRESIAPQLSPVHTYRELRGMATRLLPGCHFKRRLLWRYSLTWSKPL
jgi:ubiquinone/menaquinone biosynthesis C-methylase UbiE